MCEQVENTYVDEGVVTSQKHQAISHSLVALVTQQGPKRPWALVTV